MNRRQKLVQKQFLNNEEAVIKRLKQVYNQSLKDINQNIEDLMSRSDSDQQYVIYQVEYQKALKRQINGILDTMETEQFKTVSEYLSKCYDEGFIGTMYDLQGQGIPLVLPIDQEQLVRAVQLDSKISNGLYSRLGEDVSMLKKHITAQVSRGISTGMSFEQVAQQISFKMVGTYNSPGGSLAKAMRIARTEGHRIQIQAGMDACYRAKEKGADIVKQWDATLDDATRESHQQVDGEIRELDEKFSNGLMFPGDPSGGAAEVVNCRCALLQRARWAVGGSFTKMNNFTKQLETFETPSDYSDFKKAFFSKENKDFIKYVEKMEAKHNTKNPESWFGKMTDKEYDHYSVLTVKNPIFNREGLEVFSKSDKIRLGVVRDAVESGNVSLTINKEKQKRHIVDNGHIKGRSYLNISIEDAQRLLNELKGTGEPIFDKNGDWTRKERVVCPDFIGTHVDVSTGKETKTKNLTIIYSNTGCHIVPRRGDET